jgi:hypothetical protein
MISELLEDWLGCVWERRPGALSKPRSVLTMDTYRGHLSGRIRNRLRNKNTDLAIIPSGITSQLQPLDVSFNKSFKHLVRKHYVAWLNKHNHTLTPSGKIEREINVNNTGVDINSLDRNVSQCYCKVVFKVLCV